MLVVVLAVYAMSLHLGRVEDEARSLTFATFLVANLGLIFMNRSWSRDRAASFFKDRTLWAVTVGALLFLALVLYVSPLARLFRFGALGPLDLALSFGGGALSVAWFEIVKRRWGGPGADRSRGARLAAAPN